jgi:hypothetical protein
VPVDHGFHVLIVILQHVLIPLFFLIQHIGCLDSAHRPFLHHHDRVTAGKHPGYQRHQNDEHHPFHDFRLLSESWEHIFSRLPSPAV